METSFARLLSSFLKEWAPESSSIAIAAGDRYVKYIPSGHDLNLIEGQLVPKGSITEQVYLQKERVEGFVDKSVFGTSYYGIGYPIENFDSYSFGAVVLIFPPDFSSNQSSSLSFITGKHENCWKPIAVEEISYIESKQKKTYIYTHNGTYSSIFPLKTLELQLPKTFIRIHRSYIVNISYINQISRDLSSNLIVVLKDPEELTLTISQTYVQQVRRVLGF
ncbi:LytR/AlgR family response regulator transcription factor [Halalkalibacter krulwichiae]|uniref:Putative two-component response-regulatory protein YehT n=1 Tax=Halalkalibacter krulwichiae TaxID=199441 RepID=A0A1X9MCV5_9BACI|nr:LytTR family DNA-binding domain-containing protein [Halalkalibacter krulwichiae]ARK31265.1 putative two-component response-regulatory protein YehT [Halalkalibacter krulwichiae]